MNQNEYYRLEADVLKPVPLSASVIILDDSHKMLQGIMPVQPISVNAE